MTETTEILQRLAKPLDMARVRRRQAQGEGTIPYLEGHDVLQTANEIFTYYWSFDLLSEPKVMLWDQALTTWDSRERQRKPVLDPETGSRRPSESGWSI